MQNSHKLISILTFVLVSIIVLELSNGIGNDISAKTYPFVESTRGSFNTTTGSFIQEPNIQSVKSILNLNHCPDEIAIFVHGVWATPEIANEQTERVSLSLLKEGYNQSLIGFSWDSDTPFSIDNVKLSSYGWKIAKEIANMNGPMLANMINNFEEECPDKDIRLIAHSLGSRVVMSAIQSLDDNSVNNIPKITSVHLLGAAVDDEQPSLNMQDCIRNTPELKCSGEAIKSQVKNFYNLDHPEDNMLAPETIPWGLPPFYKKIPSPYMISENDKALGAYGKQSSIQVPGNYHQYNVISNIIDDQNSDKLNGCDLPVNLRNYGGFVDYYYCTIQKIGDNHFGYMGYRNEDNRQMIGSSGAIEVVVKQWKNENNN